MPDTTTEPTRSHRRIEHLVVLMMENRSYDHFFGFMDFGPASPPLDPTEHENPLVIRDRHRRRRLRKPPISTRTGETLVPTDDAGYCVPVGLPHSHKRIQEQINDGGMNGFAAALWAELAVEKDGPTIHWLRIYITAGVVPALVILVSLALSAWNTIAGLIWIAVLAVLVSMLIQLLRNSLDTQIGPQRREWLRKTLTGVWFGAFIVVLFGALPFWQPRLGIVGIVSVIVPVGLGVAFLARKDRKKRKPQMKPEDADRAAQEALRCMKPEKIPVLSTLAREFAICTEWYSSVPGATWPNRNFVHAGTSEGTVDSAIGLYNNNPTVFDRLEDEGKDWRIYYDDGVPQVIAFSDLWADEERRKKWFRFRGDDGHDSFAEHVQAGDLPTYTFIEPRHNGDANRRNSQHPGNNKPEDDDPCDPSLEPCHEDFDAGKTDFGRGEQLIAEIYETLRSNMDLFEKTVFLVTYDEHGGLFDRNKPPDENVPVPDPLGPNDWTVKLIRRFVAWVNQGFGFDELGVRVPTIIISPWIDPQPFQDECDHTSVIRTLRDLWGFEPLGARDAAAMSFAGLVTRRDDGDPRTDLPDLSPHVAPRPILDDAPELVPPVGEFLEQLTQVERLVEQKLEEEPPPAPKQSDVDGLDACLETTVANAESARPDELSPTMSRFAARAAVSREQG